MCQAIHNMINVCIAVKKYSEGGGGYFFKEIHTSNIWNRSKDKHMLNLPFKGLRQEWLKPFFQTNYCQWMYVIKLVIYVLISTQFQVQTSNRRVKPYLQAQRKITLKKDFRVEHYHKSNFSFLHAIW